MFSAIDDSWRWRFYTGEQVFDTYWVQQLRYLARAKKLGQGKYSLATEAQIYDLGAQVTVNLRVPDPEILRQLSDQVTIDILDSKGQVVRKIPLSRQEGQAELFSAQFPAERIGKFTAHSDGLAGGPAVDWPFEVEQPKLELNRPEVDRALLSQVQSISPGGISLAIDEAPARLAGLIPSAEKITQLENARPIWNAPIAMFLFVLLITLEWVLRKVFGLL